MLIRKKSHAFVDYSYLLPNVSAGRTARELWWTRKEFSPAGNIITMVLRSHVSPGE
jgi:hypothetical protein